MIDDIVATEWQLDKQHGLTKDNDEAHKSEAEGQLQAEVAGHDCGIVKGLADGQVVVKRHGSEDQELSGAQKEVEEGLQQAAGSADDCFCYHKSFQQFGDDGSSIPDL